METALAIVYGRHNRKAVKGSVFWEVVACSHVEVYHRIDGTYCPYHQGRNRIVRRSGNSVDSYLGGSLFDSRASVVCNVPVLCRNRTDKHSDDGVDAYSGSWL
jgi:hypothetical protein